MENGAENCSLAKKVRIQTLSVEPWKGGGDPSESLVGGGGGCADRLSKS